MRTENFKEPTAVQAQGWPIALSGENLVGEQDILIKTLYFSLHQDMTSKGFNCNDWVWEDDGIHASCHHPLHEPGLFNRKILIRVNACLGNGVNN